MEARIDWGLGAHYLKCGSEELKSRNQSLVLGKYVLHQRLILG